MAGGGEWLQQCTACAHIELTRKGKFKRPPPAPKPTSWVCATCGKAGLQKKRCPVCNGTKEVPNPMIAQMENEKAALERTLCGHKNVLKRGSFALQDIAAETEHGLIAQAARRIPKPYRRRSSLKMPLVDIVAPDSAKLLGKRQEAGCTHGLIPHAAGDTFKCRGCGKVAPGHLSVDDQVFGCEVCRWELCQLCHAVLEDLDGQRKLEAERAARKNSRKTARKKSRKKSLSQTPLYDTSLVVGMSMNHGAWEGVEVDRETRKKHSQDEDESHRIQALKVLEVMNTKKTKTKDGAAMAIQRTARTYIVQQNVKQKKLKKEMKKAEKEAAKRRHQKGEMEDWERDLRRARNEIEKEKNRREAEQKARKQERQKQKKLREQREKEQKQEDEEGWERDIRRAARAAHSESRSHSKSSSSSGNRSSVRDAGHKRTDRTCGQHIVMERLPQISRSNALLRHAQTTDAPALKRKSKARRRRSRLYLPPAAAVAIES